MVTGKKCFVNHLGQKLQKRKEKRKKKKLKAKQIRGSLNAHQSKFNGSKKKNLDKEKSKPKFVRSDQSQKIKKGKKNVKKKKCIGLQKDSQEAGGFQLSSSNSDRMVRLQEFINQEVGKTAKSHDKPLNQTKSAVGEGKKSKLIKNKKLLGLQSDQSKDTKEINRLGRLLGLRTVQKKKVAPDFDEDFGDILADIEEGSMKRASGYNDTDVSKRDITYDSSSDSEDSDLESVLSDGDGKSKGNKKQISKCSRKYDISANKKGSEDEDLFCSDTEDQDLVYAETEDYSEEGSVDKQDFMDYESEEVTDEEENNGQDFGDFDKDEEDLSDEGSDDDDGQSLLDSESEEPTDEKNSEIEEELTEEEEEEEENDNRLGFIDSEAEEGSEEESDDEEPIHDDTTEYEQAFEGGSHYYSKPEILKNGMVNDIDNYSSNSDDDTDLEHFIVDDNHVEYNSSDDDELPDELEFPLSPLKMKKKRRRVICDDDDDGNQDHSIEIESETESTSTGRGKISNLIINSDSEKDSNCSSPQKRKRKRCQVIDDDDDGNQNHSTEIESERESPLIGRRKVSNLSIISDSEKESDCSSPQKRKRKKCQLIDNGESCAIEGETEMESRSDCKTELENMTLTSDNEKESNCFSPQKRKRKRCQMAYNDDPSVNTVAELNSRPQVKNKSSNSVIIDSGNDSTYSSSPQKRKKKKHQLISDDNEGGGNIQIKSKLKVEDMSEEEKENGNLDADMSEQLLLKKSKKKRQIISDDGGGGASNQIKSKLKVEGMSEEEKENGNLDADMSEQLLLKKSKKKRQIISDDGGDGASNQIKSKLKVEDMLEEEKENGNVDIDKSEQRLLKKSKKKAKGKNKLETKKIELSELSEREKPINLDPQDNVDDIREDIYGRLRDKDGNVLKDKDQTCNGKYIPPALRKLMAMETDEKKKEILARLKRNLKGLLNRLAESNVAGIASQIEGMYQKHSHNDMNDCLSQLFFESIVASTMTPERLVQEHAMLVAVLSANIGNQIGAHLLTEFVLKLYDEMQDNVSSAEVSCKEYDNMLLFIAHLFNFRVVNARLIYDILQRLADIFTEKEVELILMVLRTVGFSLRKDDPLALKTFITQIQSQATNHQTKASANYTRVCFMLEIIHSIKNNNPSKVPNYDPSHVEHLKKLMKGLIHKGKNVTPLYVTLNDIVNSKSQGRWWIVGSAWSGGGLKENMLPSSMEVVKQKKTVCMEDEFSENFKKRAAKLQLTRPPRVNIMYIITEGSEDYLDAFDKLLQLKLPVNQEQEMFNVILLCCQKGKVYNEFFSHLACRICKFNKKYKRLLQFSVWDKFGELENCKPREVENIAKFLVHLIGEDGLSITVLKNLSFIDADAQMINFVKIILKDILLHPAGSERVLQIFTKISAQPELQFFCQSLKVFITKFLISKKKKDKPKYQMLYSRSQDVLELLSMRGGVTL